MYERREERWVLKKSLSGVKIAVRNDPMVLFATIEAVDADGRSEFLTNIPKDDMVPVGRNVVTYTKVDPPFLEEDVERVIVTIIRGELAASLNIPRTLICGLAYYLVFTRRYLPTVEMMRATNKPLDAPIDPKYVRRIWNLFERALRTYIYLKTGIFPKRLDDIWKTKEEIARDLGEAVREAFIYAYAIRSDVHRAKHTIFYLEAAFSRVEKLVAEIITRAGMDYKEVVDEIESRLRRAAEDGCDGISFASNKSININKRCGSLPISF